MNKAYVCTTKTDRYVVLAESEEEARKLAEEVMDGEISVKLGLDLKREE